LTNTFWIAVNMEGDIWILHIEEPSHVIVLNKKKIKLAYTYSAEKGSAQNLLSFHQYDEHGT